MTLALQHQHNRSEDQDEEAYGSGDMPGAEVVSAGSVTSFVRKLFQMVQGECDSIVGFVDDGTAFEVKDPRRLEQDILPKYFRHSRFQSLVRQLNFYSFKKISKERSVWIYKHAYFRRDEPDLLHALKRKTNQHGTPGRIGGVGGGDGAQDMIMDRSHPLVGSLSSDAHDSSTPRSRGYPGFPPRHPVGSGAFAPTHQYHASASLSNPPQRQHPLHHSSRSGRSHSKPPQHTPSAHRKSGSGSGSGRMYHASSSRSTGGGPSYGGQGPSYRGDAPAFAWAGAGGRPVSSGGGQGGPGAEYERSMGSNGGGGGGMHAMPAQRGHDSWSSSPQAYRQGPAKSDTGGDRSTLGRHSGNRGSAVGSGGMSDEDQALALFGLSALCQVASATETPGREHDRDVKGRIGHPAAGGGGAGSRRLFDGTDRQQQKRHRGVGPAARSRRGWGVREGSSGEEEEEEEEEEGVTSAERDDSSSSLHRRSPSNSSFVSSSSSSLASSTDSIDNNLKRKYASNGDGMPSTTGAEAAPLRQRRQQQQQQQQRTSGSGGVFCPTWDWGRAACEPAIKLPGSFVDRRFEEVDQQVGKDEEEESSKTEEEDMGGDHDEDAEERFEAEPDTSDTSGKDTRIEGTATAEVSASLAEGDKARPPPATAAEPRDEQADIEAEAKVGLDGIGALFRQFCSGEGRSKFNTNASESVFLATVTNSGDGGLREMAVFCAGPAGAAPDAASPSSLVRQVSLFLQREGAVARDLRVYAEALDPAAVDVVVDSFATPRKQQSGGEQEHASLPPPLSTDGAKLLRVFCRYAACRLGRALEVASWAAAVRTEMSTKDLDDRGVRDDDEIDKQLLLRHSDVARRVSPRLDECRWKWWRAAVRFS